MLLYLCLELESTSCDDLNMVSRISTRYPTREALFSKLWKKDLTKFVSEKNFY